MIKKEELKLSPYEYLKAYKDGIYTPSVNGKLKGLALLTDEQYIFYGKTEKDETFIHYDMAIRMEGEIHPELPPHSFPYGNPEHSYLFLTEKEATLGLPESGFISTTQVSFLIDFLEDLNRYNQEVEESRRIAVSAEWNDFHVEDEYDISKIIEGIEETLRPWTIPAVDTHEEMILGKTLSEGVKVK